MKSILVSTALVVALCLSRHADAGEWDAVGGGCSITPATVANANVSASLGELAIKSGVNGTVFATCPIQYPNGITPSNLYVLLKDDSSSSSDVVVVTYYKQDKSSGAVTQISSIFSGITSGCASTGAGIRACSTTFSDTFNPNLYFYFVSIQLNRTVTTANEIVYGVTLF